MPAPIDLHILRSPDWPRDLFERALASTEGQQVTVYVVPWTGHNGRDRAHGYRQGVAPYVAFLDADDELIPGGLEALLTALETAPGRCGAYGGEERVTTDGITTTHQDTVWTPIAQLTGASALHNAILMRRAAVLPHLAETARHPLRSNRLLRALITQSGPWLAVPAMAYRWYLRPGTLRTVHRPDVEAAILQCMASVLLKRR